MGTINGIRRQSGLGSSIISTLLLFLLLIQRCAGIINEIDFPEEGVQDYWTPLMVEIGLNPGAQIEIELTNTPRNADLQDVYVLLVTHQQWGAWHEVDKFSLPGGELNSYLETKWRGSMESGQLKVSFKLPVTAGRGSTLKPARYHVGILNTQKRVVNLKGHIAMTNPNNGHLPIQQEHLPEVFRAMTFWNFASAMVLFGTYCTLWRGPGRTIMHLAMVGLFLYKALVMYLQWGHMLVIQTYGQAGMLADLFPKLLQKIQSILELELFLLLALGYKVLRGRLNVTEIRLLIGIATISLYLGIFECTCSSPSTCSGYKLTRDIMHSMAFLFIMIAMNFNLQSLANQIHDATANPDCVKFYSKYRSYTFFRWIFLFFIAAPTLLMFIQMSVLDWQSKWLYVLLVELASWGIVTSIAYVFQPGISAMTVFELTQRPIIGNSETGDEDME